ncbi:MAG: LamG-like jellyroll fold domain-containing protein [Candidatus Paracaedibacteraceae bacterium]|nr:LamG-like jellyroll fold domain-containing protein [Candidatus Paracaedibacteraceae bacterium]
MSNNSRKIFTPHTQLVGFWNFEQKEVDCFKDLTGNSNDLTCTGIIKHSNNTVFPGEITLDGTHAHLSTKNPVLRTDKSFSIAAWVKLNSQLVQSKSILQEDEWARTAVSQNCSTHSMFYLGIRKVEEKGSSAISRKIVKWSFTIAPKDGRESGKFDWCRANSISIVDEKSLDRWMLLVGVLDTDKRIAKLYIRNLDEIGEKQVPDGWKFWQADAGLQIGRARWLGVDLDNWPGSVGPVRAFSGILTPNEINEIYKEFMF